EQQSREMGHFRAIVSTLRPQVEEAVEQLFGRTLFFNRPTPKRLAAWRAKAQDAACEGAGYAYHGYAQVKLAGIVGSLAELINAAAATLEPGSAQAIARRITMHLDTVGVDRMADLRGRATPQAVEFFRAFDCAYWIRRLRL